MPDHAGGAKAVSASDSTGETQAPDSGKEARKLSQNASVDTFRSLNELREKQPKLYNFMMQSIAMGICGEMRRQQERLKKAMRKNREDG